MLCDRKLVLEDGTVFAGTGFGSRKAKICEVVFNTSMTGYQEILSDPSYTGQALVMSYPLIGNYGLTDEDFESRAAGPDALIVRDINSIPSHYRATRSLPEYLEEADIAGLAGADTRTLVRSIRDFGSRRGILTDAGMPVEEALGLLAAAPSAEDVVSRVSCRKKWYRRTANPRFHVVVIDCGLKLNIIRMLTAAGCNVTVVPYDTDSEEILSLLPEGVLSSNGPGDPVNVPETIRTIRRLRGKVPLFGICLGHQLIALAGGARTYKLKFGHRGGNHPVKDLRTGRIAMTSQNHSYAVDEASLPGTGLSVSHRNLLDGTVEGLVCEEEKIISVQFHPESAPGPEDTAFLFSRFTGLMKRG